MHSMEFQYLETKCVGKKKPSQKGSQRARRKRALNDVHENFLIINTTASSYLETDVNNARHGI